MNSCSSQSASSVSWILRENVRSLREEDVLGELLRDGAAALDDVAGAQIGECRAHRAPEIDAEMAVEAPVLGRDHRLGQVFRHLVDAQRLAEEIAERGDKRAVRREQRHRRPPLGHRKVLGRGQGQREIAERAPAQDRHPQRRDEAPLPPAPARPPFPRRLLLRRGLGRPPLAAIGRIGTQIEILSRHARAFSTASGTRGSRTGPAPKSP